MLLLWLGERETGSKETLQKFRLKRTSFASVCSNLFLLKLKLKTETDEKMLLMRFPALNFAVTYIFFLFLFYHLVRSRERLLYLLRECKQRLTVSPSQTANGDFCNNCAMCFMGECDYCDVCDSAQNWHNVLLQQSAAGAGAISLPVPVPAQAQQHGQQPFPFP